MCVLTCASLEILASHSAHEMDMPRRLENYEILQASPHSTTSPTCFVNEKGVTAMRFTTPSGALMSRVLVLRHDPPGYSKQRVLNCVEQWARYQKQKASIPIRRQPYPSAIKAFQGFMRHIGCLRIISWYRFKNSVY